MHNVLELMETIYTTGVDHPDRTGVGRRSIHGAMLKFDLSGMKLPCVTTRYVDPKAPILETLMFVAGITNISYLKKQGVNIWNKWAVTQDFLEKNVPEHFTPADKQSWIDHMSSIHMDSIGSMYGAMWRLWPSAGMFVKFTRSNALPPQDMLSLDEIEPMRRATLENMYDKNYAQLNAGVENQDQVKENFVRLNSSLFIDQLFKLVNDIKKNPYSSRHYVSAWNPEFLPDESISPQMNVLNDKGALAPCHIGFQVLMSPPAKEGGKMGLTLSFTMRSSDVALGLPYNITGYATLAHMIAHHVGAEAKTLIYSAGDAHLYMNHLDKFQEQLLREPKSSVTTLKINPEVKSMFELTPHDFEVVGYEAWPKINYEANV